MHNTYIQMLLAIGIGAVMAPMLIAGANTAAREFGHSYRVRGLFAFLLGGCLGALCFMVGLTERFSMGVVPVVVGLAVTAMTDGLHERVYYRVSVPVLAVALLLSAVSGFGRDAIIGMLVLGGAFALLFCACLFFEQGMGDGEIFFAAACGVAFGVIPGFIVLMLAHVIAIALFIVERLRRGKSVSGIRMGPAFAAALVAYVGLVPLFMRFQIGAISWGSL